MPTIEQTIEILKEAIPGTRIGLQTPIYLHSVAVGEILRKHHFDEDIVYAGYLHDIVEDGGYTFQQLKDLRYSEKTVHLIDLASHNLAETDKKKAREGMIQRMIDTEDRDARAVKLADLTHNLSECHYCNPEQIRGYLFVKAPVFVYYGNKYFGGTEFYNEFLQIYWEQVKRFHQYFG